MACAVNLFCAVLYGVPVIEAIWAATCSPNPAGAFRPVPTAVPPMARASSPSVTRSTSLIASSRAPAYPDHSCPTVSGTASSRCVRPIFTTPAHSRACRPMVSRSLRMAGMVRVVVIW